jgi:hypothetical protein
VGRLFAFLLTVSFLLAAAPARAATFYPTTFADVGDADPTDGVCDDGSGDCSLRAAVQQSNDASSPGQDVIVLGSGSYNLSFGDLYVTGDLVVRGADARFTGIVGDGTSRVLTADSGASLQLWDLRITGGRSSSVGGGLYLFGGGSYLLERVIVAGNGVNATTGAGWGGGIHKLGSGSLTIRNSLVRGNDVTTNAGSHRDSRGGGISALGGALVAVNTTVSQNTVRGMGVARAYGGGVYVGNLGTNGSLTSMTLVQNEAFSGVQAEGGNLAVEGNTTTTLKNSILAYGTADPGRGNCAGAAFMFAVAGRNLESDNTCNFGPPALVNTNPQLGPLADNGGTTANYLPAPTSPAVDAALACPAPADDQRGAPRPRGPACDIGAVERPTAPRPDGAVRSSGPSGPNPDTSAPTLTDLRLANRRFRVGRRPRGARRARRRTVFRFELSEHARVTFRIRRARPGRRWPRMGGFARSVGQGTWAVPFRGRVNWHGRKRVLRPGVYRAEVTALDLGGNTSRPQFVRFRVIR